MESTILPNYGGCIQVRRHDGNNIPGGDMIMDKKKDAEIGVLSK